MKKRLPFLLVLIAVGAFAVSGFIGCTLLKPGKKSATASAKIGASMMVIVRKAQFYRYGPVQPGGADFLLHKGQRVTLAKREMGFDRVVTADGVSGYISSDQLALAPAPKPTPTPTPTSERHHRGSSHSRSSGVSAANQSALENSVSAPKLPDNKPQFRY